MRGPQITLSRTHPNLVRRLFALEVPEIADGTVEIPAVAREAGHRSKIAVRSTVPGVNAKGACIGPMGARVRNVMSELLGEKIDIIDYSEDPATFVGNALSPAKVISVTRGRRTGEDRAGRGAGLPAVAGDRQGRPERQAGRPADRLAHRHPQRRRSPPTPPHGIPAGAARRASHRHRVRPSKADGIDSSVVQPFVDRRPRVAPGQRARYVPVSAAGPGRLAGELLRVVLVDGDLALDLRRRAAGSGGMASSRSGLPGQGRATAGVRESAAGAGSARHRRAPEAIWSSWFTA